ncbi:hypothetical protein B296_00031476, partial [Ensete ventricosum]
MRLGNPSRYEHPCGQESAYHLATNIEEDLLSSSLSSRSAEKGGRLRKDGKEENRREWPKMQPITLLCRPCLLFIESHQNPLDLVIVAPMSLARFVVPVHTGIPYLSRYKYGNCTK